MGVARHTEPPSSHSPSYAYGHRRPQEITSSHTGLCGLLGGLSKSASGSGHRAGAPPIMTVGGGGGEGRLLRTCSLMSSSVVPVANTTVPVAETTAFGGLLAATSDRLRWG